MRKWRLLAQLSQFTHTHTHTEIYIHTACFGGFCLFETVSYCVILAGLPMETKLESSWLKWKHFIENLKYDRLESTRLKTAGQTLSWGPSCTFSMYLSKYYSLYTNKRAVWYSEKSTVGLGSNDNNDHCCLPDWIMLSSARWKYTGKLSTGYG